MKYLLLLLILTLSTLFSASLTLDKQIAQLKDADPKERFTLMNALKLRIATMNASERSSAITQLKTQMHQKTYHTKMIQDKTPRDARLRPDAADT